MSTNFFPNGQTFLVNVSATSSNVTVSTSAPGSYWLITNAGTTDCFFRISTSSNVVATVPNQAGQSQPGQMINAGDAYIVGLPTVDGGGYGSPTTAVTSVTVAGNCASFGTSTQLFITPVMPFA